MAKFQVIDGTVGTGRSMGLNQVLFMGSHVIQLLLFTKKKEPCENWKPQGFLSF
jgi:hypothetical protein